MNENNQALKPSLPADDNQSADMQASSAALNRDLNMREFYGTKHIKAHPMSRGTYNRYRGWEVPSDENPEDEGFLVEYVDSPNSNHPNHDGYISWSPKKVFESAYRENQGLTFGLALEALKMGKAVARAGWNGKGMFIVLMTGMSLPPHSSQEPGAKVNDRTAKWIGEDTPLNTGPYIAMMTAQGTWQPGWLASQTDMLSEDWAVVDPAQQITANPALQQ